MAIRQKPEYKCPVCKGEMAEQDGSKMHPNDPNDGLTVYCPTKSCPSEEVFGHGETSKAAYAVVLDKFKKRFVQE